MGLYLLEIVVSTAMNSKGPIFLDEYIPFHVPVVNFVKVKILKMGYKRTTARHYQAKGLYFPKSDSQKQCPLHFSTAVISSVNAYWVWLQHF